MAEKITPEEAERLQADPSKASEGSRHEDGLEILGPEPEVLHTSQGDILIKPMVMRQLKNFMPLAEKFFPSLQASMEKTGDLNLSALMASDTDAFYKAISVATGCAPQKLEEMTFEEFTAITTKVVVVNADFFFLTLPKALGRAMASIMVAQARVLEKAGVRLYSDSSGQGTPSTPSEDTPTDR